MNIQSIYNCLHIYIYIGNYTNRYMFLFYRTIHKTKHTGKSIVVHAEAMGRRGGVARRLAKDGWYDPALTRTDQATSPLLAEASKANFWIDNWNGKPPNAKPSFSPCS